MGATAPVLGQMGPGRGAVPPAPTPDPWAGLDTRAGAPKPDPWAGLEIQPDEAGGSWTPDRHPYLHAAEGVGIGILKGAGQTIGALDRTRAGTALNAALSHPVTAWRSGLGAAERANAPAVAAYRQLTTPTTTAQKAGAFGENVAEGFALPEVKAALPLRLLAQGGMNAGLAAAHGGSPMLGAAFGAGGEALGTALRSTAPALAESAIGVRRIDRAYGAEPGKAILAETKGIRPATVAASATARSLELNRELEAMADEASRARIERAAAAPQRGLPAGPAAPAVPMVVPLHEATAIVDRPSIAQPAMRVMDHPVIGRVGAPPVGPVGFRSATEMENIAPATRRTATDAANLARAERMERTSDFVAPGKQTGITHPEARPQNIARGEEGAQGVWLRPPIPEAVHAQPATLAGSGLRLVNPPTVSLTPAIAGIDAQLERAIAENNEPAVRSLLRVRSQLTEKVGTGEPIPSDVTARQALNLKRGVRKAHANFGREPGFDLNTASRAAKGASHSIDTGLDALLGPEFAAKNQLVHSLIPASKRASSVASGAPIGQRVLHRVAAHTGALTGAAAGGAYGYSRGGPGKALEYGTLGLLGPEMMASPAAQMLFARSAYSPLAKRAIRALAAPAAPAAGGGGR